MARNMSKQEGHKETDERAVGTGFRQRQNDEALERRGHVEEESPRLLGEYSRRAVDAADEGTTGDDVTDGGDDARRSGGGGA